MWQRLEHDMHDKDAIFGNAIRKEEQQRNIVECELESFRKSMEEAYRKRAEVKKENSALKDKVSRQEKYIGRLQDREKQNRRGTSSTDVTMFVS